MNIQQKLGLLILFLMSTSLVAAKGNIMVSSDTLKLYSNISKNLNVSTKSKLSRISSNIYYKIKKLPQGTNYTTIIKMELSRNFKGLTRHQGDLLSFYLYKNVYDKMMSGEDKKSGGRSNSNWEEQEAVVDDAIEEAKSSSEEARELWKEANRILEEVLERKSQNIQVLTRI